MLMLGTEVMERQLLEAFLEALRELPDVQAEFGGVEHPVEPIEDMTHRLSSMRVGRRPPY